MERMVRPKILAEEAKKIITDHYGKQPFLATELNSYDDKNFKIVAGKADDETTQEYTLKISNSLDSQKPERIEATNELALHLANHGFNVPVPVTTLSGTYNLFVELEPGPTKHLARLLTFVPGQLLRTVPYTESLLYETGRTLGRLTNALQNFDNPALHQDYLWSLLSIPRLKQFLHVIEEPERNAYISHVIELFESKVLRQLSELEHGIIHGDFNEQNILAVKSGSDYAINGFIDFGDSHYAPVIFDLAILCAYVMLDCSTMEPTKAPYYIIRGYSQERQISALEYAITPICTTARLCQSLVLGRYSYCQDPKNEYMLSSAKTGWKILEVLKDKGTDRLLQEWKSDSVQ